MIAPLATTIGTLYRRIAKPLLFRLQPDGVHGRMITAARLAAHVPFFAACAKRILRFDQPAVLSQTLHGVRFANPIGLAAGLDKNAELLPLLPSVGFGFGTVGSVTREPCAGNPRPWFYRLPAHKSLVVHVGLANKGAAAVQRQIARWGARKPLRTFPVVVSVAKTNNPQTCSDQEAIADYLGSLQLLQHDPHVAVLELNISCPNTYGGEPFTDPQRLEQLLSAVDALDIAKPIWVKMPINHTWQEFDALLAVVTQHNVQAVTIGNLNKKRDAISSDDLPSQVHGNLSGLPTQALSDSLIEQTYQHYGDKLLIVGVGGVFTAQDAYRKLCLGASLVELITGLIYEGPQLIGQINRELADLFARDGYPTITQAIGSAHAPRKH